MAFFKTIKHRFGIHSFAQNTIRGVYRWFLFSFLAFILAAQVLIAQHNHISFFVLSA